MALDWVEVNKPSSHGITRYRCGLYLLIEIRPEVWKGVKMGLWESAFNLTKEQAMEECEIHYMTARLQGSTYKPGSPRDGKANRHEKSQIKLGLKHGIVPVEDTEDQDTSGGTP